MKIDKICLLLIILFFYSHDAESATFNVENSITLQLNNRSFSEAAVLVSQLSGYVVKYEDSLSNVVISGDFENVPIDRFFHRILKEKNLVVDIDEGSREIVVRSFGDKTQKLVVASYQQQKKGDSRYLENLDPVTGIPMSEINAIYELQKTNRIKRLSDPNSIDPMTGKKMSEINGILKQQQENRLERLSDPNSIEPMTGKKVAELEQISEIQEANYAERLNNPQSIDPMTGKTMAEINSIFELQEKNRIERLNNPDAIDPMTGKTMAEINAILQQQEDNRIKRLGK